MNKKNNYNKLLDLAIDLNDQLEYNQALSVLYNLLSKYLDENKTKNLDSIYCHIGNNFIDLEDYNCALEYFNKALICSPNDELNTLSKYIALHRLNRDEEAIKLLFDFEAKNGIGFFEPTIEELLVGLKNGYMTNYEIQIRELAKKYNIA